MSESFTEFVLAAPLATTPVGTVAQSLALVEGGVTKQVPWLSAARIRAVADTTLYVNNVTGSDSNIGSAAAPFATILGAMNGMNALYDVADKNFGILVDNTGITYGGVYQESAGWTGTGSLSIAASSPGVVVDGNVGLSASNGGAAFLIAGAVPGPITLSGFTMQGVSGIVVGEGTNVNVGPNMVYGNCSGNHMAVGTHGRINLLNSYQVSGNSPFHFFGDNLGLIRNIGNVVCSFVGAPTIGVFALAYHGCQIVIPGLSFSGLPAAGCQKFIVALNAAIDTGTGDVNHLPGTVAGVGQYGSPGWTGGQYG